MHLLVHNMRTCKQICHPVITTSSVQAVSSGGHERVLKCQYFRSGYLPNNDNFIIISYLTNLYLTIQSWRASPHESHRQLWSGSEISTLQTRNRHYHNIESLRPLRLLVNTDWSSLGQQQRTVLNARLQLHFLVLRKGSMMCIRTSKIMWV